MKIWITKYALSGGISEHEAEIRGSSAYPGKPFASYVGFTIGTDAHVTKEAAVAAAEKMRVKKIASVKKQLVKLENLRFN